MKVTKINGYSKESKAADEAKIRFARIHKISSKIADITISVPSALEQHKNLHNQLITEENKLRNNIKQWIFLTSPCPEYNYNPFEKPTLQMERIGSLYHYKLDGLLPHRQMEDSKRYDYDSIYSGYRKGVEAYLEAHNCSFFDGKVFAYFLNHINSSHIQDLDNLEQKIFIDAAINKILLPDDKAPLLSFIMDAVIEDDLENSYTEVFVGKLQDIINIIQKETL